MPAPCGSSAFLLRVVITRRASLPRFFRSVRTCMSIEKRVTPQTRSVRTLMEQCNPWATASSLFLPVVQECPVLPFLRSGDLKLQTSACYASACPSRYGFPAFLLRVVITRRASLCWISGGCCFFFMPRKARAACSAFSVFKNKYPSLS